MADLAQLELQLEGKQNDLALIKQQFSEANGEAAGLKGALKALENERAAHGKRDAEVRAKTETLNKLAGGPALCVAVKALGPELKVQFSTHELATVHIIKLLDELSGLLSLQIKQRESNTLAEKIQKSQQSFEISNKTAQEIASRRDNLKREVETLQQKISETRRDSQMQTLPDTPRGTKRAHDMIADIFQSDAEESMQGSQGGSPPRIDGGGETFHE
eukprot:SAG11_NODE_268_length_11447_cov_3.136135_8_plen_218_part_00